jgi:glycosyltransferase involved in cell wall biosynthesis
MGAVPVRVVMVIEGPPGPPYQVDWANAAAAGCDLVRVGHVRRLGWPAVPGLPFLGQNPRAPHQYEIETFRWRPSRVFGRLSARVVARRYEAALRHVIACHGPVDLVHAHFFAGADYLLRLERSLGLPYVITEHSAALTGQHPGASITRLGRKRARRLYGGARYVVPVSDSLRAAIERLGLGGRLRVLPNPVDTARFTVGAPPPADAGVTIFSVGQLTTRKAYDVLIRALATLVGLVGTDPRLRLRIVGEGPERAALDDLVRELGVRDQVTFLGGRTRAEISAELQRAHVFSLASYAENLPVAVIEALCSGVPVVTTDVGGNADLVDQQSGRLVPPGDPDALARALLDVIKGLDGFDRRRIAATAEARFSYPAVGAQLAELYHGAVGTDVASRR